MTFFKSSHIIQVDIGSCYQCLCFIFVFLFFSQDNLPRCLATLVDQRMPCGKILLQAMRWEIHLWLGVLTPVLLAMPSALYVARCIVNSDRWRVWYWEYKWIDDREIHKVCRKKVENINFSFQFSRCQHIERNIRMWVAAKNIYSRDIRNWPVHS